MRVSRRALSLESPVGEDSDTAYLDLMPAEDVPAVDAQLIINSLHEEIMKLLIARSRFGREVFDAPMRHETGAAERRADRR